MEIEDFIRITPQRNQFRDFKFQPCLGNFYLTNLLLKVIMKAKEHKNWLNLSQ